MTSYGVNTLISDSGVIKYKIVTERWDVNTIKQPSRWTFEKGVFFEQFDEKFKDISRLILPGTMTRRNSGIFVEGFVSVMSMALSTSHRNSSGTV
jgi:hypothetical protein